MDPDAARTPDGTTLADDTGLTTPEPDDLRAADPADADGEQPEGDAQDLSSLRQEVQQLRSLKGRLGDEKGQLAQRVRDLEELIIRQTREQPQQPVAPPPDPEAERWKRVTPYYNQKLAFYSKQGYEDDDAQQAALLDAQAQFDALKYAEERADQAAAASREQTRQELAPLIAPLQAERSVASLGITGVSAADIEADLRESLGIGLDALTSIPEQARQALLARFAESRAYRSGKRTAPAQQVVRVGRQDALEVGPTASTQQGAQARSKAAGGAHKDALARLGFSAEDMAATDAFVKGR